jgi:hypothetical protein
MVQIRKVKTVSVKAMNIYSGRKRIDPHILNLRTSRR